MDLGRAVEAVVGVQARDGGGLNQGGHSGDGEAGRPNQEIPRGDVNGTGARIRSWGRSEGGGASGYLLGLQMCDWVDGYAIP